MATKLNVPVFDQEVDASNPSDAVMKFVGMAGGAALAIGAVGGGQFIINRLQDAAGQEESENFEVL